MCEYAGSVHFILPRCRKSWERYTGSSGFIRVVEALEWRREAWARIYVGAGVRDLVLGQPPNSVTLLQQDGIDSPFHPEHLLYFDGLPHYPHAGPLAPDRSLVRSETSDVGNGTREPISGSQSEPGLEPFGSCLDILIVVSNAAQRHGHARERVDDKQQPPDICFISSWYSLRRCNDANSAVATTSKPTASAALPHLTSTT